MDITQQMRDLMRDILQIRDRADNLDASTPLLGNLPELDSMAVATLIAGVEDHFGIFVEDDEISAETFETFGSLCEFVDEKVAA